jgi:release factor glutamine methyltransferase
MTYETALREGAAMLAAGGIAPDMARIEAQLLLLHAANITSEALHLRPQSALPPSAAEKYRGFVARRAAREPLAYITGERGFYGLTFKVTPDVLIPRPETEFLVEATLQHIGDRKARIVDVGTGSGCIAVAIAKNARNADVFATDLSMEALVVAAGNAARNGLAGAIAFYQDDLLNMAARFAPFDGIVSNPPYIAPEEIETLEPEVRDHEPRLALGTHPDVLHFYRRLAAEAPPLLAPGGLLAVEVGQGQADAVMELWRGAKLTDVTAIPDYAGIPRVVTGIRRTQDAASG